MNTTIAPEVPVYAAGYNAGYAAGRAAALAELRAEHLARLDAAKPGAPVLCPVCDSRCSSYRRKLNGGMAATTVKLYRLGKGPAMEWVNVVQLFPNTTHRGGEWAQIRHWGLAMPRDKRSAGKNSPGDWRLTPLGVAFVEGRMEVPAYIETRGGKLLSKSSETISIMGALGNAFDYAALIRGDAG
jgi:hypothetical protein